MRLGKSFEQLELWVRNLNGRFYLHWKPSNPIGIMPHEKAAMEKGTS